MISAMRLFLGFSAAGLLVSCGSMPKHAEVRIDPVASVIVRGAPAGANVYIDGRPAGTIAKATAPLAIAQGSHVIKVIGLQGETLYERTLFMEGNTQKVVVIGVR